MELVALLQKSQDDLGAVLSDDAFWFALGEDQKAAFRPTAQAMVRDGMRAADETFGLRAQVGFIAPVDRAIRDTVDAYLDKWWRALESAERTALRDGLNRLAAGKFKGGFQEFRKSMEQSTFGAVRGRMIAETETTRLWAMGNELSMERAGVTRYEWRTVQDDRVDEDCAQLHGKQFAVGGEGERPPKHPRCRCAIIPVPSDEPEQVVIEEAPAPALPEPTPEAPVIDAPTEMPVGKTVGGTAEQRQWVDKAAGRNFQRLAPRERDLIAKNNSHLSVQKSKEFSGVNEFGGRIGFEEDAVNKWIRHYAGSPNNLTRAGDIGRSSRRGYLLVEHELTHGIAARSRSAAYQSVSAESNVRRSIFRKQNQHRFGDRHWTSADIDDFVAAQNNYITGGHRLEEGTTEAHARRRLRRLLEDEHGLSSAAADRLVTDAAWSYADEVRHIETLAKHAHGVPRGTLGRAGDDFVRAIANEVPAYDRPDVLARFFMEKWTDEIGAISGRSARGTIIGIEDAWTMHDELRHIVGHSRDIEKALNVAKAKWRGLADDFRGNFVGTDTPLDPIVSINDVRRDATNLPQALQDLLGEVETVFS